MSILAPALMAAAYAMNVADAAHDESVVRAVGLGWTGALRAFDAVWAAFFMALPLGTRAFRAALASAAACGAAGGVLFVLAERLLASCATAPRLGATVAAIASTTATLSVAWLLEACAPGGSVLGALLSFMPLAIALRPKRVQDASFGAVGFALGLALTYEPLVGLAALGSIAAVLAPLLTAKIPRRDVLHALLCAGVGLAAGGVPFVAALAHAQKTDGLTLAVSAFAAPLGERGVSTTTSVGDLLHAELGWVALLLAVLGLGVAAFVARARPLAFALTTVAGVGLGAAALSAPAGPTRYAPPVLAAIAALTLLAGVAMQAVVRAIAGARIPLAQASASMVVLLEIAFPVRAADEAVTRLEERTRGNAAVWDEVALGPLLPGSVLLLNDRRLLSRLLASRAAGELRGDVAVVPTFDLAGPLASRELEREPKLAPFWRDLALSSAPDEFSLSSLASSRTLVTSYDPTWPRPLSRHLVPVGLWSAFEPEPRGSSDRKRALDAFVKERERLEKATVTARDPELMAATANLLRARTIGFTATGDREVVARGLDELRPFAPTDRVAGEIVRRIVMAKGPVDVKDLSP